MQERFWLRFESGERSGERVLLSGEVTVGRVASNTLCVPDSSVSGSHAAFLVEGDSVLLRDLGSTNGTRVGSDRIDEQRLAHGDVVRFGNVRAVFFDAELEGSATLPPAATPAASPAAAAPVGGMGQVSAAALAKSGKRSAVAVVVLVLALGAGGFLAWQRFFAGGEVAGARTVAVTPVDGNLLADGYSFEDEGSAWSAADAAPTGFQVAASARRSGARGLSADLAEGEWARHASSEVRVRTGRAVALRAFARTDSAVGRIGLGFTKSGGPHPEVVFWSGPLRGADFEEVALSADVPPGYDTARAIVHAASETSADGVGSVHVDDVSLVDVGPAGAVATLDEYVLHVAGPPGAPVAHLSRIDQPMMVRLHARSERSGAPGSAGGGGPRPRARGAGDASLAATAAGNGMQLDVGGRVLSFVAPAAVVEAGLATLGEGGYRVHSDAFEATGVRSLLLSADLTLMRLGFAEPARVTGRPVAAGTGTGGGTGGFAIEIDLAAPGAVELQLSFSADRGDAEALAATARSAERGGDVGGAIATWDRLLSTYPYESRLVEEAQRKRAELVQSGLEELGGVEREVERARFFALADLHRECRERAEAVAAKYAESEVEPAARELVAEIDLELARLTGGGGGLAAARLAEILKVLRDEESANLADHVESRLNELKDD